MLELRGIEKRFGVVPVLHDIHFTARPGEILGYLGRNGAGKSTTVRIVAGLLEPSAGQVLFRGTPIGRDPARYRERIGYIPEQGDLYGHLSGHEYLSLTGRLRNIPEKILQRKIAAFMEQFDMSTDMHLPISAYSKGMRQKILISAALLHDPELLICDEPLTGLDVGATMVFTDLITALAAMGKIILFSSHVLEVVEKLCNRVIILHKGRVAADDSVDRLRGLMCLPSLESIFRELVHQEDPGRVSAALIGAMQYERRREVLS